MLVGGGHSHIAVLKRLGMKPVPGVQLTLVCRDVHTPYSGMLPGLIAGHYSYDEAHIDLRKLAVFCSARFIHDEVVNLDPVRKELAFNDRPPIRYDLLSLNIGSTPGARDVPGAERFAVPVKPIAGFLPRWQALQERVELLGEEPRIAVVGAGGGRRRTDAGDAVPAEKPLRQRLESASIRKCTYLPRPRRSCRRTAPERVSDSIASWPGEASRCIAVR